MIIPKWVVVTGIIVGVAGGSISGVYLWKNTAPDKGDTLQTASLPTPAPIEIATWTDPAGFTFQYPKDLTVNKHDEDTENYAHVELASKDHPGSIVVWAKDTTAADVNAWVKTEKQFGGATVSEATMGGKAAKTVGMETPKKMITGTIADELLFMVETMSTDTAYWTGVHEMIVKSFTFAPLDQSAGSQDAAAAGDWTEEEVVE